MATPRKAAAPDPLTEELPPVPEVPCPASADEVEFEVSIVPKLMGGQIVWDWEIVSNTLAQHVGDYSGMKSDCLIDRYKSADEATREAKEYVQRIRNAIDLKLNMPTAYKFVL